MVSGLAIAQGGDGLIGLRLRFYLYLRCPKCTFERGDPMMFNAANTAQTCTTVFHPKPTMGVTGTELRLPCAGVS